MNTRDVKIKFSSREGSPGSIAERCWSVPPMEANLP